MMRGLASMKITKIAAVTCCFLALAACSKKNTPDLEEGTGGGSAATPGSAGDFKTNIGDTVYFIVDQSSLTPEAQETLRRQAQWLQQYQGVTVQVEGHADERGTREYNIALSARRATATREFLIANGVPGNRIASIAYGKERPAALCDAEQCYQQNRRTVTMVTGGANPG